MPATTTAGTHALQVNGFMPSGVMRSASIGIQAFSSPTSPARAVVAFTAGKKKLDATARVTLRDLVASLPKNVPTSTLVTGFAPKSGANGPARSLAGKRAKAVIAYLRKAGLSSSFTVKASTVPAKKDGERATVSVTWSP
jgi:outer membrane protein OmpA-like peptidoglycan-associated protein